MQPRKGRQNPTNKIFPNRKKEKKLLKICDFIFQSVYW